VSGRKGARRRDGDEGTVSAVRLEAHLAGFATARGLFESLVGQLEDPAADRLTHGQLEDLIQAQGREVMRQLLQDRMDLRSIREPKLTEAMGSDQKARRRIEPVHERLLATLFGTVTVTRIAYRALGASNLHPADAALNLPVERSSHGLRRLAAIESVRGSFADAQAAIVRGCGTRIGQRQVEELTVRAAADIKAFYRAAEPARCDDDVPLLLSFDGKGIVMRPKDLREDTRKAAQAKGGNKLKTRLSGGEKLGRKRMAILGAVYDAKPAPRIVDDVIADPNGDPDRQRADGPKAFNKWLNGSVTDNTQTVISAAFDQAEQRDSGHLRAWVALVDGSRPQIEQILTEATLRGVPVTIVCDIIHVLEYLWNAAWTLHEAGDPAAEAWVGRHARTVLAGHVHQAIGDIRAEAKTADLGPDKNKTIDKVCGYLENTSPYLDYATALAAGWPIATGIIEGSCRHLVKDRLDITGARWGLAGAEAVLKLRALISNGDFDAYYAWHLQREHQRIHQPRYHDKLTLAA
jgi:hypothetical protein